LITGLRRKLTRDWQQVGIVAVVLATLLIFAVGLGLRRPRYSRRIAGVSASAPLLVADRTATGVPG
jgi:hypothetical protein